MMTSGIRGYFLGAVIVVLFWIGTAVGERFFGDRRASPARGPLEAPERIADHAGVDRSRRSSFAGGMPIDVALPAGTVQHIAYAGKAAGGYQTWGFDVPGTRVAVAAFFREALVRAGYRAETAWADAIRTKAGEEVLVFRKGGVMLWVLLDAEQNERTPVTVLEGRRPVGRRQSAVGRRQ